MILSFFVEMMIMPSKPKHPCKYPMCPALVPAGQTYCNEHRNLDGYRRSNASERGYNSRWRRLSKLYLKKHPLCVKCLEKGRYETATVVDHIVPHRGDTKLFWDEKNWQALCKACHDVKTGREDSKPLYTY